MAITVLLENLVSAGITEAEVLDLEKDFDALEAKMTFMLKLKRDDVSDLVRLHKGNESQCNKAVLVAKQYKHEIPAELSPVLLQQKLDVDKLYARVYAKASKLEEGAYVTYVRNGAEAVSMAGKLRDYFSYRAGMNHGVDAKDAKIAYDSLSESFIDRAAKAQKTMAFNQQKIKTIKDDVKTT